MEQDILCKKMIISILYLKFGQEQKKKKVMGERFYELMIAD